MKQQMNTIRAFIAIPLCAEVQAALGDICQTWSDNLPERSVRWVKPHLMHITLRFLGVSDVESLPVLAEVLDGITAQQDAFMLRLDRPGCFPNYQRPRVIWIGLKGQLDAARTLKQEIDAALIPLGWQHEGRSFQPHLTLGRVKDGGEVKGYRWEADLEPLPIPVQAIHLIESELHRTGPVYTVRHKSVLRGGLKDQL